MKNNFDIVLNNKFDKYYKQKNYIKCICMLKKLSIHNKKIQKGGRINCVYDIINKKILYIKAEDYNPRQHYEIGENAQKRLAEINNQNIISAIKSNGVDKFYNVGLEPIKFIADDYMNKGSWLGSNLYQNPYGLWFGCGADWQNFIETVGPSPWAFSTHLYEIELSDTVKRISSVDELKEFIDEYKNPDSELTITNVMNWDKIKEDYDGLVICPYLGNEIWGNLAHSMSLDGVPESIDQYVKKLAGDSWKTNIFFLAEWYRHWETGSGVVWRASGIKDFKLVERMTTFDNITIQDLVD